MDLEFPQTAVISAVVMVGFMMGIAVLGQEAFTRRQRQGLGFKVSGLGFRVWGLLFGATVKTLSNLCVFLFEMMRCFPGP